jgi:hypothetical protein
MLPAAERRSSPLLEARAPGARRAQLAPESRAFAGAALLAPRNALPGFPCLALLVLLRRTLQWHCREYRGPVAYI